MTDEQKKELELEYDSITRMAAIRYANRYECMVDFKQFSPDEVRSLAILRAAQIEADAVYALRTHFRARGID
jgi:hypothetical protein